MNASELRAERDREVRKLRAKYSSAIRKKVSEEKALEQTNNGLKTPIERRINLIKKARDMEKDCCSYAEIGREIGRTAHTARMLVEHGETLVSRSATLITEALGRRDFTPEDIRGKLTVSLILEQTCMRTLHIKEVIEWLRVNGYDLKP